MASREEAEAGKEAERHLILDARDPEVSIIVPAFNCAWSINRCLDALLREGVGSNLEIIVIDDGSIDGTAASLESYGDAITVIRQANAGPGAARNAGVKVARANLIALMDADDEVLPGRIRLQADFMQENRDIVLTFGAIVFRSRPTEPYLSTLEIKDGWSKLRAPYQHLLTNDGECVNTMTAMFRRDCFEKVGGFGTRYRSGEDTDLWARLAELGPFAYHGRPMATVNDTRVEGKLTSSPCVYTDGPKALMEILARDTKLSSSEMATAKRIVKRNAEMMLRYDWTEMDRDILGADIELCRPIFGTLFAWKWRAIGLVPRPIGRILRQFRRQCRQMRHLRVD